MIDPSTLAVFVSATVVFLLIPGPAVTYIVARSIDQGRTAGLVSALAMSLGVVIHLIAAIAGISAILATSATAFTVVKLIGAAYLIVLGIRRLLARDAVETNGARPQSLRRIFLHGVLVNVLNPKTAVFFLAFLPQFVDVSRGNETLQLLVLGAVFLVMQIASDSAYALIAGTAAPWLRARRVARARRYVTGGTYVALGLAAATTGTD